MLQAGVGLSTQQDTENAAREAASTALTRAGSSQADFALVFATASHGPGYSLLLRTIQETTQATHVVGCSAGVKILYGKALRNYRNNNLVVLSVLEVSNGHFSTKTLNQ